MIDFMQLATPGVQSLQPYQPGKSIQELEREYGVKNAIKLASNENPNMSSPQVQSALRAALADITRYPDGNGFTLKQALVQQLGINTDNITFGNGSNDVLELIARTFVTPAHSIIFSEYAFAMYPLITQAVNAKAIVTPANNWGHDLTAMLAAIVKDTRLIFIANPNNPTGTWVTKTALKAFLEAVPEHVLVVVDEAYFEYTILEPSYPNSLEWISTYPNLIVTRTFSKAYGLAGLRVGYAISHPQITDLLNRIRQPFNVNQLALLAAETVLKDNEYLANSVALNHAGMQQLTQAFKQMGLQYIDSACNFVCVNIGDTEQVYEHLLRKGIITRPVGIPQHLRVSIGTKTENEQFLAALESIPLKKNNSYE